MQNQKTNANANADADANVNANTNVNADANTNVNADANTNANADIIAWIISAQIVKLEIGIRAIGYREVVLFQPTGYSLSKDPEEEPIEEEPLEEPNEKGLMEHMMMRQDHHEPNAQDMKLWKRYCFHKFTTSFCYGKDATEIQSLEIDDMLRIRLREAGSDEEIFTSVAWIRAFNINEPIYAELCHEFYSTYEFDEVCADDELQTKKIIKFRLGGRAHNLTLLEFARRLGLYQAVELEEEGFNVYFEGGLRNDDNFNAQDYWTTAWVITRWMKRKGAGTQKETHISCGQFISKLARKCKVLTEDVVRSLSAPIYCRDLDKTTLRDLIDFDGKLIFDDLYETAVRTRSRVINVLLIMRKWISKEIIISAITMQPLACPTLPTDDGHSPINRGRKLLLKSSLEAFFSSHYIYNHFLIVRKLCLGNF
ncbi:hypothetical protein Tco_0637210 [Tanacetum coccineum]